MKHTVIRDGDRHIETVLGEPGDIERFIDERGLFGGSVSNYVTVRHELVRYRDRDGNVYWVAGHRDMNKKVATAVHEAITLDACEGDGAWWPRPEAAEEAQALPASADAVPLSR